jgi:hypothetical protein
MDLFNILQKLSAIGNMQGTVNEEKKKPDADKDGVPDWADKKPGKDDTEDKDDKEEVEEGFMDKAKEFGKKALDTLGHKDDEELIKDLQKKTGMPQTGKKPMAVQNEEVSESEYNEFRRLAGITECGDMPVDAEGEMSPMSAVGGEPGPSMSIPTIGAQPEMAMAVAEPTAPAAKYTLSISNGENNLSMTTDVPDEIIHIMKLAGLNQGPGTTTTSTPQKAEEGYGNTPPQTNEPNPRSHGQTSDWAQKGTGAGKPEYPGTKASGDNPIREALDMILEYKRFKTK